MRTYWVYILASGRNGTLYVGVTNDLARRVAQHRAGTGASFTRKYGVTRLVHVQPFEDIAYAIAQEKRLKNWRREWKLALIERDNPEWRDLYEDITA
ncbi:MAG: GIY-YIG nuclease family protein [Defluviicoccus sp.]|nr:GIY-YIG nuclease family protein [Defluviicoccus sp.]MDE0275565.1 GIY-YIG nuclease family protein [Defluviicoccus sp.]